MESHTSRPPAAILAQRVGPDADDAAHIADAFASRWQEMDSALRPIIGQGGLAALYARGLYLTASVRPWLAAAHKPVQGAVDLSALRTALAQQIRRLKATRVVIDSLSGFELALAPTFRQDFRESLARMVTALTAEGATVLMTSELEDRYTDLRFSPYGTAFMTDAIIVQRYIEVESRLLRVLAVVKVRASAHSDQLRLFHIDDDGIHIDGMLPDLEGLLGGMPTARRGSELPVSGTRPGEVGRTGSAVPP